MADPDTKLYFLTIKEAGELLRRRELSPVELIRASLERIDNTDGQLHSFITLLREEALEQARTAEAEILRGNYKGPLHGIPIALKDLYDTAGVRTTSGSKVDFDRVPQEDATTTARLKAAGSVLMGKLAMHEFALGGPDFTTPFEPARNPWFLHRRLHPGPSLPLRHCGNQSHLRSREPSWCSNAKLVSRPLRPHDLDC
jgi:aspartyl-tRNA(Asn)/glutamyl-tRNA(Gln) amidotransferase subunit A